MDEKAEEIERLYWDEKLSQSKIADRLDCSTYWVQEIMSENSIKTRNLAQAGILRNGPASVNSLKDLRKGYIAGLIDGDGSISLQRSGKKKFTPGIYVWNSDKENLERTREVLGAGRINKDGDGYGLKIRRQPEILEILEQISSLLIVKRERAKVLKEYVERNIQGSFSYEEKKVYHSKMIKLNEKGGD